MAANNLKVCRDCDLFMTIYNMQKLLNEWRKYLNEQAQIVPPDRPYEPPKARDALPAALKSASAELKRIAQHMQELNEKAFGKWFSKFLEQSDFNDEQLDKLYQGILSSKKDLPNVQKHFKALKKNIVDALSKNKRKKKLRSLDQITHIVIHDSQASEKATYRVFTTKKDEGYFTGTHFVISKDGSIKQVAPLTLKMNHVHRPVWMNDVSVGIDIINSFKTHFRGPGQLGKKRNMKDHYETYATKEQLASLYSLVSSLTAKLKNVPSVINVPSSPSDLYAPKGKSFDSVYKKSGVTAHGYTQNDRQDGVLSVIYLHARSQGKNHKQAITDIVNKFNKFNGFSPFKKRSKK